MLSIHWQHSAIVIQNADLLFTVDKKVLCWLLRAAGCMSDKKVLCWLLRDVGCMSAVTDLIYESTRTRYYMYVLHSINGNILRKVHFSTGQAT